MVRRFLPAPRFDVDVAGLAARGERGASQDQIDAQTFVATKTTGAVIPPGESLSWLFEAPEYVAQTEVDQALQTLAFVVAAQNLAPPGCGVMHVTVVGCDIIIRPSHTTITASNHRAAKAII